MSAHPLCACCFLSSLQTISLGIPTPMMGTDLDMVQLLQPRIQRELGKAKLVIIKSLRCQDLTDYLIIRFNILYNTLCNSIIHIIYQSYILLATISFLTISQNFYTLTYKIIYKFYFAICICSLTKQNLSIFSSLHLLNFKSILALKFFDSTSSLFNSAVICRT